MVTVGSIIGGTFRFVRANPVVIAIWSGVMVFAGLISILSALLIYTAQLASLESGAAVVPSFPTFVPMILVMLVIFTVLWAAVFRAVIFPVESRFAYMRLGMDELRLLGTILIVYVGGYLIFVILGMIGVVLLSLLAAAIGGKVGGTAVAIIAGLMLICALIWAVVRISPAAPLTIYHRKIVIGPAWRLTRGAFWRLFGAYLVIALLLFIIYLPIGLVQMGPALGDMLHPTDPNAALRVAQWQVAHYSSPIWIAGMSIVTAVVGGIALALQAGVAAVATTQLIDLHELEAPSGTVTE